MGNTNGGGAGGWRDEHVVSASYHTRPLASGSSSGYGDHHGVVVRTAEGNNYLIHHPGPGGRTTVTDASHMSTKWTKDHDIAVGGSKTVQEVFNGAGGRTNNFAVNYATAGTCIGAAANAEATLKKK